MNKIVFISGATSGIGEACAHKFAGEGFDVIINGRRTQLLNQLKQHLETKFSINAMVCGFDVQQREQVFKAINDLPENWKKIDILVNNAGLALGRDSFEDANLDDWQTMLHTNVDGLLNVSRAILPFMISRKTGHIINMGSIAGKEVYENGNIYCASKFAVDAISRSMRIDLLKHRIKVTAVNPGAVETEFSLVRYHGDKLKAGAAYDGFEPLKPSDVANIIFYCASLPPNVCINDLSITCLQQAGTYYFSKTK